MAKQIETRDTEVHFQVVFDRQYDIYIVREKAGHYSFSYQPCDYKSEFDDKKTALEQVRRLTVHQRKGNNIRLVHCETPGAFETVADTKYGPAWN